MLFMPARGLQLVIFLGALCSALVAAAQRSGDDFVVTTAGDTLRGRIQLVGKFSQTLRLYQPGTTPATFTASQVRSYGTGHTALKVSKNVSARGGARLLVPLVHGYVDLYAGPNAEGVLRYYLQPIDSSHVVEVAPEWALLTYARLLPDCPELEIGTAKFQQRYPYTSNGLRRLVMAYNECRHRPTALVQPPSGLRASYGFKVGVNRSNFELGYDDYSQKVYATNPSAAVGYQAGLVVVLTTRSNFGLQAEATYLRLSGNYGPAPPPSYNSGINVGTYAVRVRYSQLQIPLLLHYSFGRGSLAPYLHLGPCLGFKVANNSVISSYAGPGTPAVERPYMANIGNVNLGGAAGAGLLIRRNGLPALLVEGRYDYLIDNTANTALRHRALRLEANVLF